MSDKMTCPACNAHTSSVLRNFQDEVACPSCGLPHDAAVAVLSARGLAADREVTAKYEEAIIRAARAEAELALWRDLFGEFQNLFGDVARRLGEGGNVV